MAKRKDEYTPDTPALRSDDESAGTSPRDPERRAGLSMLMKIALAAVVLSSLVISISCVMQTNQLRRQSEEMEQQIDDYNEKIKRIIYYLNKDVDHDYIIEYARENLGLYFPDEEIDYNDVNE